MFLRMKLKVGTIIFNEIGIAIIDDISYIIALIYVHLTIMFKANIANESINYLEHLPKANIIFFNFVQNHFIAA